MRIILFPSDFNALLVESALVDLESFMNFIPLKVKNFSTLCSSFLRLSKELRMFSRDRPIILSAEIDAHKLCRSWIPSIK